MLCCAAPCCSTARKGGPHCWLHTFCNNESLNLFLVLAVLADDDSEEGVAAVLGTIRPASGGDGEDTSSTDEEVAATPSGEGGERRAVFLYLLWEAAPSGEVENVAAGRLVGVRRWQPPLQVGMRRRLPHW